jgi:lipopolysaccharide/colanic/teichoic acid biosynthesis glycosyltransferase
MVPWQHADDSGQEVAGPGGRAARRRWGAKCLAERCLAAFVLAGISPLFALLALLVWATSGRPVFYRSNRLGRGGKVFCLYKFRSMRVNAPAVLGADGKLLTLKNDPRLTPAGRFLRLGFDELPQLFNVVRGEMCLVGPRPDVPSELERYTVRQRVRLQVLPGITGLAAVVGGRDMNNAQNYELDVRYVESSSLCTDLLILAVTLPYSLGMRRLGRRVFSRYLAGIEQFGDGVSA